MNNEQAEIQNNGLNAAKTIGHSNQSQIKRLER